uniref:HMG box domain-containing protein n=1 Tax=Amphora coffeiformis TaxID=265554 RepID=A0A7S3L652_9STRA|eukprot:scaffold5479_cov199-Amphora_coffeaeformis.AAC.38
MIQPVFPPNSGPSANLLPMTEQPVSLSSAGASTKLFSTDEEPVKPKRPLSAYNYFFKAERARILASLPVRAKGKPRRSHGKMGFQEMAKAISAQWKAANDETKNYFKVFAEEDMRRYKAEKKIYEQRRKLAGRKQAEPVRPTIVSFNPQDFEPLAMPVSLHLGDPLSGIDEDTSDALLAFFQV